MDATAGGRSDAAPGRTRALLEMLRAPLLLSPLADVLAGACVGRAFLAGRAGAAVSTDPLAVALAGLCGVALLGAGMAQNALADLDEDRRTRPDRPLARGALPLSAARLVWRVLVLAGLGAAALVSPLLLQLALVIVLVSTAYHVGGKRLRLTGCVLLGAARGLCLGLGVVAALGAPDLGALLEALGASRGLELPAAGRIAFIVPLYAVYIAASSLHASTDDEDPGDGSPWSLLGILLAVVCLLFLLFTSGLTLRIVLGTTASSELALVHPGATGPTVAAVLALVVTVAALVRLVRAAHRAPPPALTGVMLSGLYLFDAVVCLLAAHALDVTWPLASAVLALALFGGSRLLLRRFPPS